MSNDNPTHDTGHNKANQEPPRGSLVEPPTADTAPTPAHHRLPVEYVNIGPRHNKIARARIHLSNPTCRKRAMVRTRALFDPGSTTSFLSPNMAIILHLSLTPATIHFSDGSQSSTSTLARVHFGNHSTTHTFAIRDHMPTPVAFGIDFWDAHHMISDSRLNYIAITIEDSMPEADYIRTSTTPGANQAHHDSPVTSTTRALDEHTVTTPTHPSSQKTKPRTTARSL
jgi:hypothetical protein